MKTFTADQQQAIEHRGNVIVSAGAGSGKTSVLVERYVRLLVDEHQGWPVAAIVAITFTRKAAAELKFRIMRKLQDEMAIEERESTRYKRLVEVRRGLGAAPIGTIHNFCGRLLRQFAFDAGIDPDYVIIEGAQESVLRGTAVRTVFSRVSRDPDSELYRDLLILLGAFSPNRLMEIFALMLANRANLLVSVERYVNTSAEELWRELLEFHEREISGIRGEVFASWKSLIRQMDGIVKGGKVAAVVGNAMENLPDELENWDNVAAVIDGLIEALLVLKGTCRVAAFKNSNLEPESPLCVELMALAAQYRKLNLSNLEKWDEADIVLAQRFARLFTAICEEYGKSRGSTDNDNPQLLDYADLELQAERLLAGNGLVRHRARRMYPYFILDEFQDTSESQWNILKWFVLEGNGELRPESLFVVGDKKQGVYGFREANVNLFSDVQDLVANSNGDNYTSDGRVSMTANFRTNPVPLNFINGVFEELFQNTSRFSVEFEPLQAHANKQPGEVEFLLVEKMESRGDEGEVDDFELEEEEEQAGEPQMVAAHIKELIDQGAAAPGDIALLFRKRAPFAKYEAALKALDIPVVTQQASNLFHQKELADVVAAMGSVIHPQKDFQFVHFLRSSLGGFTDNLLLKIGRAQGGCFYDKLRQVAENFVSEFDDKFFPLTADEIERVEFVMRFITTARESISSGSLYDAVHYVLEFLGARHSVLAAYRGMQARANLDKLLELAQASEAMSYEEFLIYIEGEEQSLRGIGEAADLASSSAVKIMTIHASKGLEFPVIYLPELNSGVAGIPATVSTDGKNWLTVRLPKGISQNTTFLAQMMTRRDQEQQKAEERRILYVAMTRAKNRLILSADLNRKPRGETFYAWLQKEFDARGDAGELRHAGDFVLGQERPRAQGGYVSPYLSDKYKVNQALLIAEKMTPDTEEVIGGARLTRESGRRSLLIDLIRGVAFGNGEVVWQKVRRMLKLWEPLDVDSGLAARWENLKGALVNLKSTHGTILPGEVVFTGDVRSGTVQPDFVIAGKAVWIVVDSDDAVRATDERTAYGQWCISQGRPDGGVLWEYPFGALSGLSSSLDV